LDIYSHLDPLDAYLDNSATIEDADASLWVDVVDPAVIDVEWLIDGQVISGITTEELELDSITSLGLLPGNYQVMAVAADQTNWVRIRQDELQQAVTWDVAYYPGDFDHDQEVNFNDIDALTLAVAMMSTDGVYDLNSDGFVDASDRDRWLRVSQTFYGDVDLNGSVEFADFLVLSENFGLEGGGWATADFDLDNVVAFADFLLLSEYFGKQRSAPVLTFVPEPSGFALAVCALLLTASRWKGRFGLLPAGTPIPLRAGTRG
jgi:hypothetical protein